MRSEYDAVVIGSGVGGCCIAALLAHAGKRVLLAEKRAYLGGRFSTVERNGFRCATGGLAVPVGRNLEEVCQAVGVHSGVRPSPLTPVEYLYNVGDGVCPPGYEGSMGAAKSAQEVFEHIMNREPLAAVSCAVLESS